MIIKPSYIVEWMLDNKNKMFLKIPNFLARAPARLGSRNSQLGSARTTPGSARLELEIFWPSTTPTSNKLYQTRRGPKEASSLS